jgi:hypothetical protein
MSTPVTARRNEAARRYLDAVIDRPGPVQWLTGYALMSSDRAEQRTRFMDRFRSCVINCNLGQDLVRPSVEPRGRTPGGPRRRWIEFLGLLQAPLLPSELR